jgi:dTDP-4-dehydrorhamnose reductase
MSTIPLQLNNRGNKILVSGATGMLGIALVNELHKSSNNEIYCVSKSNSVPFDFVKLISLEEISDLEFEAFFHCAAEVNVNLCEKDLNHAIQSNCEYAKLLFERVKANFNFFISTDSVYEGIRGDYQEIDEPKPINNYAISKLKGEEVSIKRVENLYVIRTNIIGDNSKNKGSLFEWAKKELIFGNPINGFNNIYFNPLSVQHLSIILLKIFEEKVPFGVYNLGCDRKLSKYNFLMEVANLINADTSLIKSVEFNPSPGDAQRPMNTTMNCSKIRHYIKHLDLSFQTTLELLMTS